MEAAEVLRYIRARGGLTRLELAQLADVSPSTIRRIEQGTSSPSWSIMGRIMTAAGYEHLKQLRRSGDISAVRAARIALGEIGANDVDASTVAWLTRWRRAGYIGKDYLVIDVDKLAFQAGIAAPLFDRPGGRIQLRYDRSWQQVADEFGRAHQRYAVTGITATRNTRLEDGAAWPVMYVEDAERAEQLLELPRATRGAVITLLTFDDVSSVGTVEDGGVSWVSPGQALIDSYAGPGRMPDQAEGVAAHWQQNLDRERARS